MLLLLIGKGYAGLMLRGTGSLTGGVMKWKECGGKRR